MLAVDIGNSNLTLAAFAGERVAVRVTHSTRDIDMNTLMRSLQEAVDQADSPDLWVASVYPQANAFVDSAAERIGLRRHFIRPGSPIIPNTLSTPETTGVDRLLAALAAGVIHYPNQAGGRGYVVVQCGSAATVDLVDREGTFRGGYILPGPALWLQGLGKAALLPDLSDAAVREEPEWKEISVGDNTRDAILNGMHLVLPMAVATATLLINTPEGTAGEGLPVAVTGGWGETAALYMRSHNVYDADLVLQGIRLYAEANA